jgi:hypothetical protein
MTRRSFSEGGSEEGSQAKADQLSGTNFPQELLQKTFDWMK